MSDRNVVVVADSTSDLPETIVTEHGIALVPLNVRFGDDVFKDRVEMSAAAFLDRLKASDALPSTSQPAPAEFERVFRDALDAGNDVVCVTIAGGLSGTFNSARLAAEAVDPGRIRVVDSKTASIGAGLVALTAARAAASGEGLEAVAVAARDAVPRVHLYAALQTLEYLHRGGRLGRASLLLGSVLNIKPIVGIREGAVEPIERVRTWRRAVDRLAGLAEALGPLEQLAVLHVGNPEDAATMAERLRPIAGERPVITGDIGPVVATYAGPGCVGLVALAK